MARRHRRADGRDRRAQDGKLDPDRQKEIITAIRAGACWSDAAERAGVGRSTLLRWKALGEDDDAPEAYREFREQVDQARADARVRLSAAVMKDALGGSLKRRITRERRDGTLETEEEWTTPNGRIALKALACMDPQTWGNRSPLPAPPDHGQGDDAAAAIDPAVLAAIGKKFEQFVQRDNTVPDDDVPPAYLQGVVLEELE